MKTSLVAAVVSIFLFAACKNTSSNTESNSTEKMTTPEAQANNGPKDPVCEMPKDNTWTEHSINGSDTAWFCSETCKMAYEGNPKKYQGKPNS